MKKKITDVLKIINKNIGFFLIGIGSSFLISLALGIPTALIPNRFYTRMIPATKLDIFFLVMASIMLGAYTGLFFYLKHKRKMQKNSAAYTGATGSFLAISCPICIKLLVLLFGTAALMAYLQPLRPYIGFLSIALIGFGLYTQIKLIRCKTCYKAGI